MKTDLETLRSLARALNVITACDCAHCKVAKLIDDIIADLEELKKLESSK